MFFKAKLGALVAGLGKSDKHPPVYIIIDELDRCRPPYAISMLEEIKHLFDVPGLVFIIAVHGNQLEKSIKAVYGSDFNSEDYLQRFFNRQYKLSRPPVAALAMELFEDVDAVEGDFAAPAFVKQGKVVEKIDAAYVTAGLLAHWQVSPRRVQRVIDCLRLCRDQWQHKVPIELPLLLNLIVQWERGGHVEHPTPLRNQGPPFPFSAGSDDPYGRSPAIRINPDDVIDSYARHWRDNLKVASDKTPTGIDRYIVRQLQGELAVLHGNSWTNNSPPLSVWRDYPSLVESVGRFLTTA